MFAKRCRAENLDPVARGAWAGLAAPGRHHEPRLRCPSALGTRRSGGSAARRKQLCDQTLIGWQNIKRHSAARQKAPQLRYGARVDIDTSGGDVLVLIKGGPQSCIAMLGSPA